MVANTGCKISKAFGLPLKYYDICALLLYQTCTSLIPQQMDAMTKHARVHLSCNDCQIEYIGPGSVTDGKMYLHLLWCCHSPLRCIPMQVNNSWDKIKSLIQLSYIWKTHGKDSIVVIVHSHSGSYFTSSEMQNFTEDWKTPAWLSCCNAIL